MKNIFKIWLFSAVFVSFGFAYIDDYQIASWNLQGSSASTESKWSVSVRQLISGDNAADILAIQEAGTLPATARPTGRRESLSSGLAVEEYIWDLGTRSRPNQVYIYYSASDSRANRVNLALVSNRRADEIIILPPPTTASRPIIGIRILSDVFFSIHALSRGGNDSGAIITSVYEHFRGRMDLNWLILGDFNRDPSRLSIDQSVRSHIRIIAPSGATQRSGGTLDYAVAGNSDTTGLVTRLSALLMLANLRTQIVSDHFPVNFRVLPR